MKEPRRIKPRTLSNYYMLISAIFNYAKDEGYIEEHPAQSRKLKEMFKLEKKPSQRELFSTDELTAIFRSPLYTGSLDDDRNYNKPGQNVFRRGRFWVPLLALYQGLRCNEACQLYTEDVKTDGGIPFLHIRADLDSDEKTDKRLKNKSSWREIPIHPELLKIGFLEYVDERRRDSELPRLFPTLPISQNTQRYSHGFSKWFGRFLTTVFGKKSEATFHSFRHHFRTALMEAGVARELVEALGGWKPEGSSEIEYRHAQLPVLLAALSKVSYPALDLTHLLGNQLGGSGSDPRNLVTLQQNPVNSPEMRSFEGQIRMSIEGGQVFQGSFTPVYQGSNLVPRAVTIMGEGSGGFSIGVSVLNPPGL